MQQQHVGEVGKSIIVINCKLTQYNVCQILQKLVSIYRYYSEIKRVTDFLDHIYTVSQKVPTLKLSITLSNLTRFSKFFHWRKAYEIC